MNRKKPVASYKFNNTDFLLTYLPFLFLSFFMSNVLYLSLIAVLAAIVINNLLITILRLITFIIALLFLYKCKYHTYFTTQKSLRNYFLLIPYFFIIALRSPMYYPNHDELAFHAIAGDYANSIWTNNNFMPMHFATYYYPALNMVYSPFINFFGFRFTNLIVYAFLYIWLFSLNIRFKSLVNNQITKHLLNIVFIFIVFIPHLIAIQPSLMVDFVSLVFAIEALYQFFRKSTNYTFATILVVVNILIKQSTSIFFIPIFAYYILQKRKSINYTYVFIFTLISSIYFLRLFMVTGNPLFNLFNSVFRSSLYPYVDSARFPLWGPTNLQDLVIWPIIGQFTDRYGEGAINMIARVFFSTASIVPFLASIYILITRRSLKYFAILISYFLWSYLSGYGRYYAPLNALALIILVLDTKSFKPKVGNLAVYGTATTVLITVLSFSSIKTDFSWRPHPAIRNTEANIYFLKRYKEGLSYVLSDTPSNLKMFYASDFKDFDYVMPVFRGWNTYYAYLAYLSGRPVISGVTKPEFDRIMNDQKIHQQIKDNLTKYLDAEKILLASTGQFDMLTSEMMIHEYFDCKHMGNARPAPQLQVPTYFSDVILYSCVNKNLVQSN